MGSRQSGVIDTTIFVDIIRKYTPAIDWSRNHLHCLTTPFTVMELLQGARNASNQQIALKVLREFGRVYPVPMDLDWAEQQFIKYHLSHNVRMYDCLIASICFRLQIPLYTHNPKHMKPILGDLAVKPY